MRTNGILSLNRLYRVAILGILFLNVGCMCCNGWAMNRAGMRQYARGHYVQARHRFAHAVAQDPCNPDYRHNLAMALQKQGDTVGCEKILRHNLTINAMHQPTYHSLAQVMVTQGRTADAQDLLAGWAATQPYVPEANVEMAWIQRESGDVAGAEQSLQQALKVSPTHPIALAQLGQLYQSTGHPDQAASYYQRSLAANWDQPEVQSRLATLTDPQFKPKNRSAMMQNSIEGPMMAYNSNQAGEGMMTGGPILSGNPMMASDSILTNDPMMTGSRIMMGEPMTAGTPMMAMSARKSPGNPFGSDSEAVSLEDVNSNPLPRRRSRKEKDKDQALTAFPLPNFDGSTTAWAPTGTYPGQPSMAYRTPAIGMDQVALPELSPPQLAGTPYSPTPLNGYSQELVPQADPAHFYGSGPETTASLPVVDPH